MTLYNGRAARVWNGSGNTLPAVSHQPRSATRCCPPSPSLVPLLDATTREGESVLLCARLPRDSTASATLTLRSREPHLLLDLALNATLGIELPSPGLCLVAFPESPQHHGRQSEQPQLQCNSCHLVSTLASSVVPAFSWQIREREICIAIKK